MTSGKKRAQVPRNIADELLFRNRHTCCICRSSGKHVQIHHIDGDPSNNTFSNLAVLCLDCHSKVTSEEGLGREYSVGELRKYKREWESINTGGLMRPESLTKSVKNELLKADISRLMIQVISLNSMDQRLEAIQQIENYSIYFVGVREFVLNALHTVLLGSVWSEPDITAACAETLHHFFWGFPGPDRVPMDKETENHLRSAIGSLQWIAEYATENLRSLRVQTELFESLEYLYVVAVAYKLRSIALSVLGAVEINLRACYSEKEFKGIWREGVRITLKKLQSMKEVTPSEWEKEIKRIKELIVAYS